MVEISLLTGSDRAGWEALARSFKAYFETEVSDHEYEQTWRRLLDGEQIRGDRRAAGWQRGRLSALLLPCQRMVGR